MIIQSGIAKLTIAKTSAAKKSEPDITVNLSIKYNQNDRIHNILATHFYVLTTTVKDDFLSKVSLLIVFRSHITGKRTKYYLFL